MTLPRRRKSRRGTRLAPAIGSRSSVRSAAPCIPGATVPVAALCLELGALHAAAGDAERAMRAFERSVEARQRAVGRGGREAERVAAWTAAAHVARSRGAEAIAPRMAKLEVARSSGL